MVMVLLCSIIAGACLGAPFGAVGALVVDAALAHKGRRIVFVSVATALADAILAAASLLIAKFLRIYIERYGGWIESGVALILFGFAAFMIISTARGGDKSALNTKVDTKSTDGWILAHAGPVSASFLISLLHPGSIAAFLAAVAFLNNRVAGFHHFRYLFPGGVFVGAGIIFAVWGLVFWRLRHHAAAFVHYFRYGLAVFLALIGIYLLFHQY